MKRKGRNLESRSVPMNQRLHSVLWSLWNARTQNNWVFLNEKTGTRYTRRPKMMRSLCRRAFGEPRYGFHEIRHFVATFLHDNEKVSTGVIADILGHKSKRTTEIYLHSFSEGSRLALDRLDGVFDKTTHTTHTQEGPEKG